MPHTSGKHVPKHRQAKLASRVVGRRHARPPQGAAQHGDAVLGRCSGDRRCRDDRYRLDARSALGTASKRLSGAGAAEPTDGALRPCAPRPRSRGPGAARTPTGPRSGPRTSARPRASREDDLTEATPPPSPGRCSPVRLRRGPVLLPGLHLHPARAAGTCTPTTRRPGPTASRRRCPARRWPRPARTGRTTPPPRSGGASATSRAATARPCSAWGFKQGHGWY